MAKTKTSKTTKTPPTLEEQLQQCLQRINGGKGTIADLMRLLNEHYFVITVGKNAKTRVAEECHEYDLEPLRFFSTFQDFKSVWVTYKVKTITTDRKGKEGETLLDIGTYWFHSHERRHYRGHLVFAPPGAKIRWDKRDYNLWRGYTVDVPRPPIRVTFEDKTNKQTRTIYRVWTPTKKWKRIYQFLRDIICQGNEQHLDYLLRWMAYLVQFPGRLPKVAICLRGDEGTGKGTFYALMRGFFDPSHTIHLDKPGQLTGKFNAHMSGKILVFADEAFFAGDPREAAALKSRITEEEIPVEPKGIDLYEEKNYTHLIIASNNLHFIRADKGARRFYVLELSAARKEDTDYFDAVMREYEHGGRDALFAFLMAMPLDAWKPEPVMRTPWLKDQQHHSMASHEKWWKEMLTDASPETWRCEWSKDSLMTKYHSWCTDHREWHPKTKDDITRFLVGLYGEQVNTKLRLTRGEPPKPAYRLPPLESARLGFDAEWTSKEKVLMWKPQ